MSDWKDNNNEDYQKAIGALRSINVEPSSYMKTRVLANVRAQAQKKPRFQWFYIFTASMATAAVAFVISFQLIQGGSETMEIGKPYIVKADLREIDGLEPAFVKVELVGEVQFASKKFSRIREMRSLTMSWEKLVGKQYLPVVVEGTQKGESHVRIHFYDKDNNVIKSQDFKFDFKRGA